jgi:hypothetical protein
MSVESGPSFGERVVAWLPLVGSAALVAYAAHLALEQPLWALLILPFGALLLVPALAHRRRQRELLRSGNVEAVLEAWSDTLERVPHPETMAPLIAATALAAHGFTERARHALGRARRGSAWEAAIEHRLLVETLLGVFEGEREHALESAAALRQLPLPGSPLLRGRVSDLRAAMGAFARAFSHQARSDDLTTLERAARDNPLIHWAMRYAAAVARIDRGEAGRARRLLEDAPPWPDDSALRAFHDEIRDEIRRVGEENPTRP